MSSSPDTSRASGRVSEPRAWVPADFSLPAPERPDPQAISAEELLAIFTPAKPRGEDSGRASGVVKNTNGSYVRAWLPDMIAGPAPEPAVPPFVEEEPFEQLYRPEPPDPRVVAEQEARSILTDAETSARELLAAARLRQDEMFAKGYADGKAAAEKEMAGSVKTAAQLVTQVEAWWQELACQSEPVVLDLVRDIARRLFGSGLEMEQPALEKNFELALQKARSLGHLNIFVHPEDAARLTPAWLDLQVSLLGSPVKIIPNPDVTRGGCYIDGQLGSVDARVETRLAAAEELLAPQSSVLDEVAP